ncbi:Zinc finger C2H2-type protein [Lasiodiplodia theobromae]|uniref:Zinc finger protein ZFP69 n=1 Tax=Lasiodiplodia theobromae TaxID=45133 RepID=A0A5N5DGL4_9PEZI|nr:Zinc finger protein ZFP69 [Lasiodiplodia theobromae]KAF9637048.1 Zinc finger C2H2-type protein [Lasiodiplodia theobromae]
MSEQGLPPAQQGTKRTLSGSTRPKHSKAPTAHLSQAPSATSLLQEESPITPEIFAHIDAIKHIDDKLIFELLRSARFYASIGAGSSSSADSSRRNSTVPSLCSDNRSDNRSSIASSAMFSLFSKPSLGSLRSATSQSSSSSLSRSKSHMELRQPSIKSDRSASSASNSSLSRSRSVRHDSATTMEKPLPPVPMKDAQGQAVPSQPTKNYACTFCDQTFKHRAYWLCHEEELHEQPRRWTCPDCYRSFFAEKKYRKHHYESHGCSSCGMKKDAERSLNATERCSMQGVIEGREGKPVRNKTCAEKAMLRVHNKKAYGCGFCVTLCRSWSERCDHVARHYETGVSKNDWCFTNVVKSLLLQSELAIAWEKLMTKEHTIDKTTWPNFVWDKREARDLVRSMEQNGMVHDKVKEIARSAYDHAHIEESKTIEEDTPSVLADVPPPKQEPLEEQNPTPATQYLLPMPTEQRPHSTPVLSQNPIQHPIHPHHSTFSVSSMPDPPAYTGTQRASKEFELLSQAIDEQLASGPFVVDFDFNPPWDPMQMSPQQPPHQEDIVAFTHPGAYSAFTAAHPDKGAWPL